MVRNKVHICRNYHIQPSEIERLAFWEYEMVFEEIRETSEREKEEQEDSEKNGTISRSMRNIERMSKNPQSAFNGQNGFKMPSMPQVNIPKI